MSAYAAAASFKDLISLQLQYVDVIFPPHELKSRELVLSELESFLLLLESMDSRSRKMMRDSPDKIAEAIREVQETLFSITELFVLRYKCLLFVDSLREIKEQYGDGDGDEGSSSKSKSNMVGLRDEWSQLKDMMVNLSFGGIIISIFGMAGIGKTTLALEIFQDLDISEWFDCRAWVTVGTEWNSEEITRAILSQTGCQDQETNLKQWLEGKRYLIVLDNIWCYSIEEDIESYLGSSFPNNENGNRILLTSRVRISYNHPSFPCYPFEKLLLNKEESWDLLCEKVFAGGSCPSQLVEPGKKIADKCDGLPLTILTVADLLSKAEEAPESLWLNVTEQKKHQLFIDAYDQISEVLYPNFKELKLELKSCFLYMGVFPLKYDISATKLINLWIAKELVVPSIASSLDPSLESFAAQILRILHLHCLIWVQQKSTSSTPFYLHPNIKTCTLHSSWWHFCQREAWKTSFFYALDCYNDSLEEEI